MKYILLFFSLFLMGFSTFIYAQTPLSATTWSGYVDASPHGNFASLPAGTGLTFSQWRRYSNSTYQSASDGYNSQNLNGNPLGYISSYIKTDATTSLNITQFSFVARRSNTGPTYFKAYLLFPATGVNSLIGTGYLNSTNNETITFQTDFCIPANDSVVLRLVLGGATHAGGTFRVLNGTSILGSSKSSCSVQSVLINPPATVCMGDDAVIALTSAPGTSVVYNVNNQSALGQLLLDTVVTNGSGTATININNVTGDSTVRIISAFTNPCCAINIMQEVFISPQPIATPLFTQIAPYCSGATMMALPSTSNNGITGSWSPAINNTATTTYTFTPAAGQCALGTQTMTVHINPAPAGIQTATVCYGQSYTFNGITYTASNYTATDTLAGSGGCDSIVTLNLTVRNAPQISITHLDSCKQLTYNNRVYTQSTTLYDTLYAVGGCDSLYKEIRITIHNNARLVQIDTSGCDAVWLNGIRYTTSTVETDTLYNTLGCDSVYRQFNITVNRFNLLYTVDPEDPYEMERFNIAVSDEFDGNFEVLSWHPANLFPVQTAKQQYLSATQPQNLKVFGRSIEGCADSVMIPIKLKAYSKEVMMPNAFTPNGDGRNDVFVPKLKLERAYNTAEFRVYNRYGQIVHSTANLNSGWDGTSVINGKPLDQGVYFYSISILFLDGTVNNFKGEITLLR
ncbi:hypothetical protein DBR32_01575 [Taibaiella sp. KBW10]|uniref:gliding motility-associated C-terminal domain-containing protein n=1 Tax=Taibaiella sp. KBW10 TaxID=2153357 RepID=UPI000F59CD69|nr:gliding motility-associated C-terminal domain-containing protein [Taibaiella sp. KBW10]RQO32325.1 hypothetical protein DBR32_01575 [Taibaiella sp. KBW10]